MTTIIFGCFCYESFNNLKLQESACSYYDFQWPSPSLFDTILDLKFPVLDENKDMYFVKGLGISALKADKIVFDVTNLKFPFNDNIVSLIELWIVCNNKVLFDKATFFVDCKPVNKNKLQELFNKNEAATLKELQELFI